MKLIAILLALAALNYLSIGQPSTRYQWFVSYAKKIQLGLAEFHSGLLSCIIIIAPILLIFFIIQSLTDSWLWGAVDFIIDLLVLWYCLWPESLANILENKIADEAQATTATISKSALAEKNRQISQELLIAANEKTFAVLFWFFILGGFGALMYRLVALLRSNAQPEESSLHAVFSVADLLQAILDWVPARLAALTYVVAGNFVPGFAEWRKEIWSGLLSNGIVLVRTGIAACGFNNEDASNSDHEENRSLVRMTERALIVWIVIAAIFTLGKWFY